MLIVQHLTLRQGNHRLLNQVAFQVKKGDIVTLMGLPVAESLRCFRGWSAHCRLSFRPPASSGSTNDASIRSPPRNVKSVFCFRMPCCLTISASGRTYCWRCLPR